jgi:hypothetical protein
VAAELREGSGCRADSCHEVNMGIVTGIPSTGDTIRHSFCRQVRQSALFKQVVKAKPSPAPRAAHPAAPCLYHLRAGRRVARARR